MTRRKGLKEKCLAKHAECPEMTAAEIGKAIDADSDYVRATLYRAGLRPAVSKAPRRPKKIKIQKGMRCSVCHNTGHLERAN